MRYELCENGYISKAFFGCYSGSCTLYEGDIPEGYTSLVEWADNANIRAYKIVDGNLTYDAERDEELQEEWANCGVAGETILYNNENGEGHVTLKESCANFKYIEVFFKQIWDNVHGSTKVYKPDGKIFNAHVVYTNGTTTSWTQSAIYSCSGTSLTRIANTTTRTEQNVGVSVYQEGNIAITRVVGYR